jgi:monothiol glutaredoxin
MSMMLSTGIIRTTRSTAFRSLSTAARVPAASWTKSTSVSASTSFRATRLSIASIPNVHLGQIKLFSDVSGEEEALKMIQEQVDSNKFLLYMKGNPGEPGGRLSDDAVKILQSEGIDFSSVDVMSHPAIREALKTVPKLYVNGEFIGGCDTMTSMHDSGELAKLFKEAK